MRPVPVLRGDAVEMSRDLYRRPLTLEDAQAMVDILSEHFALRPLASGIAIMKGRTTIRRWGYATWRSGPKIILHPKGLNEGTVIHEFSHWLAGFSAHHGPKFKEAQMRACRAWEGR